MSLELSLADLKLGEKVTLHKIIDQQLSEQLYTMGCIPGETLHVERIAPLGDPLIININGNFLSIRKKDARKVKVINN